MLGLSPKTESKLTKHLKMSSFDVPPIIRFLDLTFGGQYI